LGWQPKILLTLGLHPLHAQNEATVKILLTLGLHPLHAQNEATVKMWEALHAPVHASVLALVHALVHVPMYTPVHAYTHALVHAFAVTVTGGHPYACQHQRVLWSNCRASASPHPLQAHAQAHAHAHAHALLSPICVHVWDQITTLTLGGVPTRRSHQ